MKTEPHDISSVAVSVGAAVSVEWQDGELVITIDMGTVSEGLADLVREEELSEEHEDFISAQIAKGAFRLASWW